MESIFPIFGPLHAEDSPTTVTPPEKPPRKRFENEARLFIVSANSEPEADEQQPERLTLSVTGDIATDTVTLLNCLACVCEFFNSIEPADLRRIAEAIRGDQ